jgi:hypothetical protein
MKFKIWLEEEQRRKSTIGNKHHKDHAHGKRGQLAGNVRYSGKGGFGSTQQPNNFRNNQPDPQNKNEIFDAVVGGVASGLAGYAAGKAVNVLAKRKRKKEEEKEKNGK